jgi:hypothetical protein
MSDVTQPKAARSAREDIAFMRSLAEEGASAPLFGGSFLIFAGLIYGAASLATWLVLILAPPEIARLTPWIWGGALAVHMLTGTILGFVLRRRRTRSIDRSNRVFLSVWNGVGVAILSSIASFSLTAWLAHQPVVFIVYPSVVLLLYGMGWTATAAASKERWTWAIAGLSFLFAIASGALAGNVNLPLLFVPILLILLVLPGALLLKRAGVRS